MAGAQKKSLDTPDQVRTPDKGVVHLVEVGGASVGRATLQPGWRWSESIKPIVGGDSCQINHLGIVLAGAMRIEHMDGTAIDLAVGDIYQIQPGHDAWVVGDDEFVGVEFDSSAAASFAKG